MAVWQNPDRENRWMYGFQHAGRRYSGYAIHPTTGNEARSEREALTVQELIRDGVKNKPKPAPVAVTGYALAQGVAAWKPVAKRQAGWVNVQKYLRELLAFFKPETALAQVTTAEMQRYVTWALKQKIRVWTGGPGPRDRQRAGRADLWKTLDRTLSPVSVNKRLSALSQVLELAHKTIDPATMHLPQPHRLLPILPEVPFLEEPQRKARPIALPHLAEIYRDSPPHLQEVLVGVQLTRLRLASLMRLPATRVDEHASGIWTGDDNKAGREEFIPLGPAGLAFFLRLKRRAQLVGIDRCFLYQDPKLKGDENRDHAWRPLKSVKTAFRTRLKALGLTGQHRFHQTKTTSINQLRRLGADPVTIHELAQHTDFETTRKHYLAEDVDLQRQAMARYESVLAEAGLLPAANVTSLPHENPARTKREVKPTNTGHKRRQENTG